MRERRVFMMLGIVLAVFTLGLAYAAISTNLEITGNVTGTFDSNNFQVKFSKVSAVTGTNGVNVSGSTATIVSGNETMGTFSFTGFTTRGQTQSATWTISNENEAQLYALIEITTASEVNSENFKATIDLADDVIAPNETTTATVTVECIKTPEGDVNSGEMSFGITATSSADEVTSGGSSGGTSGGTGTTEETLPTTTSYVGSYADVDGDGTVDGIIFADQAVGTTGTGQWGTDDWGTAAWGTYSVPKVTSGLKEYEVTQTYTSPKLGQREVVSPVDGTSGTDRFFVMALSDFTTSSYSTFYWYYSAYSEKSLDDIVETTANDFGEGYTKTGEVIAKWNKGAVSNGGYGAQNDRDIWKHIQDEYDNGWFIPSKAEWSAFGGELGITTANYSSTYGLSYGYWSSSQYTTYYAYDANFDYGSVCDYSVYGSFYVRLCTTF